MDKIFIKDIVKEFSLELITCKNRINDQIITSQEVNRPGLLIGGYSQYVGEDRIQVLGMAEISYLDSFESTERYEKLKKFFEYKFPCIIIARGLKAAPELIMLSEKYETPILRTNESTSRFISRLIRFLNLHLAQCISIHGVFVEVYGEGVLILGESGIGKSETALELVKRGHRLVSDDLVEIRKVSDKTLIGTAPDIIKYLIEIRGLGILDVKNLFGAGAIKASEEIDFIIHLKAWNKNTDNDTVNDTTELLNIAIPSISIFVKPGKNLAMLVESAALKNLKKKLG